MAFDPDDLPHPRETFLLDGVEGADAAFVEALARDRLHHAWLLTGPEGAGKASFAYRAARRLLGAPRLQRLSTRLTQLSHGKLPMWTPAMPQPLRPVSFAPSPRDDRPRVVYLAACVSRVMGPAHADREREDEQEELGPPAAPVDEPHQGRGARLGGHH